MNNRKLTWKREPEDKRDLKFAAVRGADKPRPPSYQLHKDKASSEPPVWDQGDIGSCHDVATEVLTDRGWRLFSKLDGGESLATVDPESTELSFEKPTRLFKFNYSGEMVCGVHAFLDFKVTPDHNMLVRPWVEKDRSLSSSYRMTQAKDIGWYCGLMGCVKYSGVKNRDTYTLKGVDHKHIEQRSDVEIPMKAWLNFLGIYIAEGTMAKNLKNHYRIQIAASKDRERTFVMKTLSDIGVKYCALKDRFAFENKRIYYAMIELGLLGVKAPNKFVPDFVFDPSGDNIREFLVGHFMGDGSCCGKINAHYTSSWKLADDIQRLYFLSGSMSSIGSRPPRKSTMKDGRKVCGKYPEYRIGVHNSNKLAIERKKIIKSVEYSGCVYCAEMPSFHTLVTRRNGKILISGNCTAHGNAYAILRARLASGRRPWTPSRLGLYYMSRELEGTVNSDEGAYVRTGLKVAAKHGVAPEHLWSYNTSEVYTKPPMTFYAQAALHKTSSYYAVGQNAEEIESCIYEGFPVVFGFMVYKFSILGAEILLDPLGDGKRRGFICLPRGDTLIGGHCAALCGYDSVMRRFTLRNSYGPEWGDGGYGYIPYEYVLNAELSSDFWTARVSM